MSRRSYGYGSYGRRSYGSGSYYRGKNRGHKKAAAAVMIAVLLCIAGVGSYFFFFHNHIEKDTDKAFKQPSVSQQPPVQDTKTSSLESSADPNKKGYFDNNVFIYDKQGYELFYGGDDTATVYLRVGAAEWGHRRTVTGTPGPNGIGLVKSFRTALQVERMGRQ